MLETKGGFFRVYSSPLQPRWTQLLGFGDDDPFIWRGAPFGRAYLDGNKMTYGDLKGVHPENLKTSHHKS